jgi:hypothetical protein
MSNCIKYGIFSHVCDRAIRGPKHNETNFEIFIPQRDQITQYLYKKRLEEKLTAKEEFDFAEIYGNITQSLHETAKEVIGEKYKRQSRKTWWTEETEGQKKKKKKLYQKWLNTKRYEDKQVYLEIKRQTR